MAKPLEIALGREGLSKYFMIRALVVCSVNEIHTHAWKFIEDNTSKKLSKILIMS